ncbi:MAG: class I SAM-dependent methyltransferase [Actinomycetota bacterium]
MRGEELISRYRSNYSIPQETLVTEEMILRHWELEKELTGRLLGSQPSNRWQIFEECYTTLYSELAWLNDKTPSDVASGRGHSEWARFIGPPPKYVYEVGSGKGALITYLAGSGYVCRGSEVTKTRGEALTEQHSNLSWGITDGVHLDEFEPAAAYDAVISDQVIEHLHPDDLSEHFRGAFAILKHGGRYVFSTPHRFYGPMDVSRVFKCDTPKGMHLKEYTFAELVNAARQAGFGSFAAPLRVPRKVRRLFGGRPEPRNSRAYLGYLMALETVIGTVSPHARRRKIARAARAILFDGVIVAAFKN